MSSDYDIEMSLDDTLELDAIISDWSNPDTIVELNGSDFNMSGFQTSTAVLDPQSSGKYTITVNGQELTVNVTDASSIPDSVVEISINEGNGSNNTQDMGIEFTTSQQWSDFQSRFSANTNLASDEEMVIGDTNGNDIAVIDASTASAGDVLTFYDVNLSANETYVVFGRTPSNEGRGQAYDGGISFPASEATYQ